MRHTFGRGRAFRQFARSRIGLALLAVWVLLPARLSAQVQFEQVAEAAGISYTGASWGGAWGDFDGDGLPDLFVGNHGQGAHLYRNLGDGTFFEEAASRGIVVPGDAHGAAWADFDDDRDLDLVQIGGAGNGGVPTPHQLFVNQGSAFLDLAEQLGVAEADPDARGRAPLWFDQHGDGRLDLLIGNWTDKPADPPSAVYRGGSWGFTLQQTVGWSIVSAHLGDLSGDGAAEVATNGLFGFQVWDPRTVPFTFVGSTIGVPTTGFVKDAAIADFDRDGQQDLFLVRSGGPASSWAFPDPNTLRVYTSQPASGEVGIDFATAGNPRFRVSPWTWSGSQIWIGASGLHPNGQTFTLTESNPSHHGLAPRASGAGVYVGYDDALGKWSMRVKDRGLEVLVTSTQPIAQATAVNFTPTDAGRQNYLFRHGADGKLTQVASTSGFAASTECNAVGAGDFDNDMDVDLFLVCSTGAANTPDRLYLNDGTGRFALLPGAGGAEGATTGRGDTVAVADYDRDGFLDLFVTNGDLGPPLNDGPHQLYRNLGNGNHWLEVDLRGTWSNPAAIGARVRVTAGGVTQLREQAGGMHVRAQDHVRLHFGLGAHPAANVEVTWPSGRTQALAIVSADQVLSLVEPWPACGLGTELAGILPLIGFLSRRRRTRKHAPPRAERREPSAPR